MTFLNLCIKYVLMLSMLARSIRCICVRGPNSEFDSNEIILSAGLLYMIVYLYQCATYLKTISRWSPLCHTYIIQAPFMCTRLSMFNKWVFPLLCTVVLFPSPLSFMCSSDIVTGVLVLWTITTIAPHVGKFFLVKDDL